MNGSDSNWRWRDSTGTATNAAMSQVADLRKAVTQLPVHERAALAEFLLDNLETAPLWVDDDEVERRSQELESGAVKGLTRDEFTRLCGH